MRRILLSRVLAAVLCTGLLLTAVASLAHRHEARSVRACEACLHGPAPVLLPSSGAAMLPPEFSASAVSPEAAAAESDPLFSASPSRAPPA